MTPDHTLSFRSIEVSLLELKVRHGGQVIHFTLSELRVLLVFLQDPYRTISTDELVRRADLTNASALWQLVSRLRALLGQQYIHNEPRGYVFAKKSQARADEDAVTVETARR